MVLHNAFYVYKHENFNIQNIANIIQGTQLQQSFLSHINSFS